MSLGENSLVAAYQGKEKRTVEHQRTSVVTDVVVDHFKNDKGKEVFVKR